MMAFNESYYVVTITMQLIWKKKMKASFIDHKVHINDTLQIVPHVDASEI